MNIRKTKEYSKLRIKADSYNCLNTSKGHYKVTLSKKIGEAKIVTLLWTRCF